MSKASSKAGTGSGALTVKHVTNSLGQIETWIGAVRDALAGLPSNTPLSVPKAEGNPLAAPIFVQKECPPPPRRRRRRKPAAKKS